MHITFGCCIYCGTITRHVNGRKWNCGMHAKRFKRVEIPWTDEQHAQNRDRIRAIYTDGKRFKRVEIPWTDEQHAQNRDRIRAIYADGRRR